MRFQSDSPVGVSLEAGVLWWLSGGWGSISVSSSSAGMVLDLNQFVIGFVSAGGLCRLGLYLGWLGLGIGFRGLCGGGRPSTCVSIRVHECALCEPSVAVLTGLVCVGGWFLCFFSQGCCERVSLPCAGVWSVCVVL